MGLEIEFATEHKLQGGKYTDAFNSLIATVGTTSIAVPIEWTGRQATT